MSIRHIEYIILLILSPLLCSGQQYGFRNFSLEEGLPQTEVLSMIVDSKGAIWTGTNGGGLSRFNGNSFKTFTKRDGLPDDIVSSICEDSEGNIWFTVTNAIVKYDGVTFRTYSEPVHPDMRIYPLIYCDRMGQIWVSSLDEENLPRLLKISGDNIVTISDKWEEINPNNPIFNVFYSRLGVHYITTNAGLYELGEDNSLSLSLLNEYDIFDNKLIRPVHLDDEGFLWIISIDRNSPQRKIYKYKNGVINDFEVPETPFWDGVFTIFKDKNGRCWFLNFGNGVTMYNPHNESFSSFSQINGLSSDFILAATEDHEGNIWLASRGGGLIKYSRNSFISFDFDQIIDGNIVRNIFQDSRNNLWFSLAGTGIVKYDGQTLTPFSKDNFPGISNVRGFKEVNSTTLLLASINGIYHFNGKQSIEVSSYYNLPPNAQYTGILVDGNTTWLTTFNIGLIKLTANNTEIYNIQSGDLKSNILNSVFKDSKGRLWICANSGIAMYQNGKFKWYSIDDGLRYPMVIQAAEDLLGRIWFASYQGGIHILDGETFSYLTVEDGLVSDNIYSLIADRSGNMWAGTQNGVDRIQMDSTGSKYSIRNYGIYDGFTGIENNGTANFIDSEDYLWFGTVKGAMRYNPEENYPNDQEPLTHITGVRLFFRELDWKDEAYSKNLNSVSPWFCLPEDLIFPHDSNHLSFDFEAISYQAPEKVRYQWKLEGLDKDWSPLSRNTEAVYANIPPGEYTFLVRAMNNDGIWNKEPAGFSFEIKPPWWGTWYFFLFVALLLLTTIVWIFRFRVKLIEAKKVVLEKIIEEKTTEVREQNYKLEQQKEEIVAQAERLKDSYTNLENLSEIGKTITSQLEVEKIIDTVYESINRLMDASVFGIGIYNEKDNSIDFPGVKEKGETLDFLSFSLEDELRLSAYCYQTRKEVFINDYEKEYSKYLPAITPAGKSGNSSSILYLPLILNDKVIGVITVQSFKKNAYTEYHLNILRNLAVYTKIALENASAYRQIELQSEDLIKANKDISKQKKKIEQAHSEMVELNNDKSHLISILAHDLRNPLTSSLAIANNLTNHVDNLKSEEKESLGFLVNSLNRMFEMISKILDVRMIEQKKININCERADLGSLVSIVSNNMKKSAQQKNITIHLENNHVFGSVDRNYLIQVFENLLSNAIKFSPKDKNIWIKVLEKNGEVLVDFIDEGPGIKENEMHKLFGKFQKLSARPTDGEDSTGLGLSIVKKYVDVMGGRVWCESKPGKGAKFSVAFQKLD
jgi:signal transduction histidine kinase/ligand-binding sensor domain-containing protein